MKHLAILSVLTAALGTAAFVPTAVEAKGCVKGAIVGGLAGKVVGHGTAGAAVGCAYNVHKNHQAQQRTPTTNTNH